jgi:predicted transcriptional regulator
MSDELERLLRCVTPAHESADTIFRRYAGVPSYKSLAKVLRTRRTATGKLLQHLAQQGVIHREVIETPVGHAVRFWKD